MFRFKMWVAIAGCAIAASGLVQSALGDENARVPAAQPKERERPKADNTVRGTLMSVDAEKNTITITSRAFDRKTGESTDTNKSFAVAKDAKILQDETAAKLADLKKGFTAVLTLDGTNAVSISVDGGTGQGEFRSFNADRNTIVILAGRGPSRQVVHLLKTTKVLGADGKAIKVEDLKPGTKIQLTRSVEEDNTVVRIQIQAATPEPKKRER